MATSLGRSRVSGMALGKGGTPRTSPESGTDHLLCSDHREVQPLLPQHGENLCPQLWRESDPPSA